MSVGRGLMSWSSVLGLGSDLMYEASPFDFEVNVRLVTCSMLGLGGLGSGARMRK